MKGSGRKLGEVEDCESQKQQDNMHVCVRKEDKWNGEVRRSGGGKRP